MAAHYPVTIVSPHRDDAAFSLALLIEHLLAAACTVRVVNCYTVSAYAPGLETASEAAVSRIRALEDELFFRSLPNRPLEADLGRCDAPLRLGCLPEVVCHPLPFGQCDQEEMDAIGPEIARAAPWGAWLLPLAVGNHIDHRVVLAGALLAAGDRALGFYEDLPYAARLPDKSLLAAVREVESLLGSPLHPLVAGTGDSRRRKRSLINVYRSQLSDAGMDEIEAYARLRGGERVWLNDELYNELSRLLGR